MMNNGSESMDPRIAVYGLFTAFFFAWQIYATRNYSLLPILMMWIGSVLFPQKKMNAIPIALFLLFNSWNTSKRCPCTWESDLWALQADVVLAIWILSGSITKDSSDAACQSLRHMFAWFYFAAGFWKLNSHFWDPNASCATVFFIQLVAQYLSPFVSTETTLIVARFAKTIAPLATLIIELAMGGLKLAGALFGIRSWERAGVLLALVFHLMVCFMPQPNDISGFAFQCAARLIVFASPEGTRTAITTACKLIPHIAAVAAVVVAIGWSSWTPNNWAFAAYVPVSSFVFCAVAMEKSSSSGESERSTKATKRNVWVLLASAWALMYSFGGIMTGLQEEATPNMFANLKVHGGSNHFLLPTGLLFHIFSDSPDRHPFGGGVVRIEETTSEWLQKVYPADLTPILRPSNAAHLLELVGNPPPSFFNPGASRVLGDVLNLPPPKQFFQYTVPALEFKRLMREAKSRDRNFDVTFAQLPGTKGDEVWRTTATKRRFHVQIRNGTIAKCEFVAVLTNNNNNNSTVHQRCGMDDLPMVSDDSVPIILQRISMHHAYPIVPGTDGGIRPSITCFGP